MPRGYGGGVHWPTMWGGQNRGMYNPRYPLIMGDNWGDAGQEDLRLPSQYGEDDQPRGYAPRGENDSQGKAPFDYNKLSILLGLAGNALAPNTPGGRLGGNVASYGMHERESQRRQGLMDQANRAAEYKAWMEGQPKPPTRKYITGWEQDPNTGEWFQTERLEGDPEGTRVGRATPKQLYGDILPEGKLHNVSPGSSVMGPLMPQVDAQGNVSFPTSQSPVYSAPFEPRLHNVGPQESTVQVPNQPGSPTGLLTPRYTNPNVRPEGGSGLMSIGPDTEVWDKNQGRMLYRSGPATPKADEAAEGQASIYDQPPPQGDSRAWYNPSRLWSGPAQESPIDAWERQRQSIIDDTRMPNLDSATRATKLKAYKLWLEKNPRPSKQSVQPQQSKQGAQPRIIRNPKTGERLIEQGGRWVPYGGK